MVQYDALFETIRDLVMRHSPSGVEGEVDDLLMERFEAMGLSAQLDPGGNLVVKILGQGRGQIAITAHKDEIGCIVTQIQPEGRAKVRKLGGSFPWVYGEGVVDLLGDSRTVSGILSFGSRHVSHASPQFAFKDVAPLRWADAWVETKLSETELDAAGVRPGTRMVIGKHRKQPIRLKDHIASYTLDNKASLAVLLELAKRVKKPQPTVYLVASAREEVGGLGALYFTQHQPLDAVIALEIAPIAPEYNIKDGPSPVVLCEDARAVYDESLNQALRRSARKRDIPVQLAVINGFGSDASHAIKHGHVGRAACVGFPTLNTHGFEIAHLGAIANCVEILEAFCSDAAV